MRIAALGLVGAIGLAVSAVAANAAPAVPANPTIQASNIVQVAGGCGWGAHPNRWGHCRSSRAHRPYAFWRPRWPGYYGGGYGPESWSPSDHVANQLNRQQLMMGGY